MSVQLVLFPQNYQGFSYTASGQSNLLSDSNYFLSASSSFMNTYSAGNDGNAVINGFPGYNNWRGFYLAGQQKPQRTGGNLILTGQNSATDNSGVYQKLNNLTVGQNYSVTVYISATVASGLITFGIATRNDTCGGGQVSFAAPPTPMNYTFSFTAQNQNELFVLQWKEAATGVLNISSILVSESTGLVGAGGAGLVADPMDGQVVLDLYEETSIPLTLSVDDFKNVAEKVQSYSKDFNLPATKRNNRIFDNIYEITRTQTGISFNPYIQTRSILKENGFTIFDGFLRLIEIKEQNGETSYNVNLFSKSIALADILKGKTFSNLDISELDHIYNLTNVSASNQGVLALQNPLPANTFAGTAGASTTNVLRYPLCNWNGKIRRQPTSDQINPGSASPGFPAASNDGLATFYRPWIKLKYLIQNIFRDAGFTFTSTLFDSAEFSNLYMDFNWGSNNQPAEIDTRVIVFYDSGSPGSVATAAGTTMIFPDTSDSSNPDPIPTQINTTTGVFTSDRDGLLVDISGPIYLKNSTGPGSADIPSLTEVVLVEAGTGVETILFSHSVSVDIVAYFIVNIPTTTMNTGDTLFLRFKDMTSSGATGNLIQFYGGTNNRSRIRYTILGEAISSQNIINKHRGKLKQWDFLKDIFTMFNLVTIQDKINPTNLIIDTYDNTFLNNSDSETFDWTQKVDQSTIQIEPLKLKRDVIMKYKTDDKDYCAKVFKNACFQYEYGSKRLDGSTAIPSTNQLTNLTGEEKVELKIFSSTVVKPIFSDIQEWIAPCIYGANDEGSEFKSIENNPRILYNVTGDVNYTLTSITFFVPPENGATAFNVSTYQRFSHTSTIPSVTNTSTGYNFEDEYGLIGIGSPPVDNLFNRFYSNYFSELYNPDTRIVKISALLSPADIANFEFYDKIQIKNRLYRVNKIDYKPGALTKLELILIP
tara:strand:+ start:646 stop:3450 length:2805 start_codon:yes stop_codon:yes gene_type:complete